MRQTRKLMFGFAGLLVFSFVAVPVSAILLAAQAENSGILYFLSAMASDFGIFLAMWQDFGFAILESLPLAGMLAFAISIGISVFTLRLFLHRKRLLVGYLTQSFA